MRSVPLALTFALGSLLISQPVSAQVASVPDGELAVVHINGVANCSAFLVRPGTFLTAMHCAHDNDLRFSRE